MVEPIFRLIRASDVRATTLDLEPLAAFRLGYNCIVWRLCQRLFWDPQPVDPDLDGADKKMRWLIDQLDAAVNQLANSMSRDLAGELRRALSRFRQFTDEFAQSVRETGKYSFYAKGGECVPGADEWMSLCDLARKSLPTDSQLMRWFSFGQALGRYRLELHEREDEQKRLEKLDLVPDFAELARRAAELPDQHVHDEETLKKLACQTGSSQPLTSESLLAQIVQDASDKHDAALLAWKLARRVESYLENLPQANPTAAPIPPTWMRLDVDTENGTISLDGKVFPASSTLAAFVKVMIGSKGKLLSSRDIRERHRELQAEKRIDRLYRKLPKSFRQVITSERGKGYRLVE